MRAQRRVRESLVRRRGHLGPVGHRSGRPHDGPARPPHGPHAPHRNGMRPALGRLYAQHIPQLKGLSGGLSLTMWTIDGILVVAILIAARKGRTTQPFPALLAIFV